VNQSLVTSPFTIESEADVARALTMLRSNSSLVFYNSGHSGEAG
jgi:ATP adenylyltransferase/5',5'''-P-1,P-4-tetraphosphate phosphorylase II